MNIRKRWEVGSSFHWQGLPPGPFLPWPHPAVWYLLGRHAVLALMHHLGAHTLWLPDYFCQETAQSWARHFRICHYDDNPSRPHPQWDTLLPSPEDVVLAVNYFGMREGGPWKEWRRRSRCLLLEDHTHDPHSRWAQSSRADYAVCSVRKLFPVPDGGILWSPAGRSLPPAAQAHYDTGAITMLAAMLFKTEYLAGQGAAPLKEKFRRLQLSSEALMEATPMSAVSAFTREYLSSGAPRLWRQARRKNAARLARALADWGVATSLYTRFPDGSAPLGFPLVFELPAARDRYRRWLQRNDVYCPIHWVSSSEVSSAAHNLSARILTIPCDHRYTVADMDRVADVLRKGSKRFAGRGR